MFGHQQVLFTCGIARKRCAPGDRLHSCRVILEVGQGHTDIEFIPAFAQNIPLFTIDLPRLERPERQTVQSADVQVTATLFV